MGDQGSLKDRPVWEASETSRHLGWSFSVAMSHSLPWRQSHIQPWLELHLPDADQASPSLSPDYICPGAHVADGPPPFILGHSLPALIIYPGFQELPGAHPHAFSHGNQVRGEEKASHSPTKHEHCLRSLQSIILLYVRYCPGDVDQGKDLHSPAPLQPNV